jgi:CspA family cold shock protein
MPKGIIKFYNESRGYGFISCDPSTAAADPGDEVYVHYSQIEGRRSPREGQAVTFDVKSGDRGLEAVNVQLVS